MYNLDHIYVFIRTDMHVKIVKAVKAQFIHRHQNMMIQLIVPKKINT